MVSSSVVIIFAKDGFGRICPAKAEAWQAEAVRQKVG
jgi:hypothetical protein